MKYLENYQEYDNEYYQSLYYRIKTVLIKLKYDTNKEPEEMF